jgi:2'-5' RNA ligase
MLAPRARVTWVAPERLHVTVRFIGEVDEQQIASISAALAPRLDVAPFTLGVQGVGVYPPRGAPRVVWAGIGQGVEELSMLEAKTSGRLAECGLPREDRPFRPHLTLARVKDPAGLRSTALLEGLTECSFGQWNVDAITLFESRTSAHGPVYVPLQQTLFRR